MQDHSSYQEEAIKEMREQITRLHDRVGGIEVELARLDGKIDALSNSLDHHSHNLGHYATKHDLETSIRQLEDRLSGKINRSIMAACGITAAAVAIITLVLNGTGIG